MLINLVSAALFVFILSALIFVYIRFRAASAVSPEKAKPHTMQDLLGMDSVRSGLIQSGSRFCRIVAVGSVNYLLMSEEESSRLDTAYAALLASINFPVQFYTQTRLLDLTGVIIALDSDLERVPDALKPYGAALRDSLRGLINVRSVMLRNSYIVIVYEGSISDAQKELNYRQQMVLDGLMRCGLPARPLNDQQIADLFYAIYNSKTRALIAPLKLSDQALCVSAAQKKGGSLSAAV
jgi:hypothetical protein